MKKTYTIAQVLATPEGQYVSAEVFAILSRATPPRGKGPWTAQLTDSTGTIVGKFWGGDISHWEGKRVKLSGQGMMRKSYKNVPELSVGDKTDVSYAGAPGAAAQAEDAIPGDPEPSQSFSRPVPVQTPPRLANAPTAIHGATVGGALARAVDIYLHNTPQGTKWDDGEASKVEQITRDLVAIQQRVETGDGVPF